MKLKIGGQKEEKHRECKVTNTQEIRNLLSTWYHGSGKNQYEVKHEPTIWNMYDKQIVYIHSSECKTLMFLTTPLDLLKDM